MWGDPASADRGLLESVPDLFTKSSFRLGLIMTVSGIARWRVRCSSRRCRRARVA